MYCGNAIKHSFCNSVRRILMANHWFHLNNSFDHLHSKSNHNKMHRQQFLHVIGQSCWMSLDRASLLLIQWDPQSSLKCNSIWLIHQPLVVIRHWIWPHKDLLNNNKNKPMPMLDPCKNVHVEIQQLVYQDQFHIEGSSNRPYLCRNCLLLFCQMFMTLFSYGFHESCFFLTGGATHIVFCVQLHQLT